MRHGAIVIVEADLDLAELDTNSFRPGDAAHPQRTPLLQCQLIGGHKVVAIGSEISIQILRRPCLGPALQGGSYLGFRRSLSARRSCCVTVSGTSARIACHNRWSYWSIGGCAVVSVRPSVRRLGTSNGLISICGDCRLHE